ncbi:hypothetical protein [Microbulbifer spongiae]|uniref:Uncharacterized protein n=1 Tax=Microbulbifer spongiae TaxID=2944933 RepID=A0ABY9E790_9GAMM|nr:hypothetical protein [Microbulbifer sp. MI-G]WKD48537.1 hypothetical protein M8T91_11445 [Microbulbifer sp. MI-G]
MSRLQCVGVDIGIAARLGSDFLLSDRAMLCLHTLWITSIAIVSIQRRHIFSVEASYDLTRHWTLRGKHAYRLGQLSLDRQEPEFFDSRVSLYVLRADWHFVNRWDLLIEGCLLDLPNAQDRRSGAFIGLCRHLEEQLKLGIGYHFTDCSDDHTQRITPARRCL